DLFQILFQRYGYFFPAFSLLRFFFKHLLCSLCAVFFFLDQLLELYNRLNVLFFIGPVAGLVFFGTSFVKDRLPITQHMIINIRTFTDFSYRVIKFFHSKSKSVSVPLIIHVLSDFFYLFAIK